MDEKLEIGGKAVAAIAAMLAALFGWRAKVGRKIDTVDSLERRMREMSADIQSLEDAQDLTRSQQRDHSERITTLELDYNKLQNLLPTVKALHSSLGELLTRINKD